MSGMPPPPPKPPGGDLRRAALLAGAAGAPRHAGCDAEAGQQAAAVPRDTSLPLPLPWSDYFDHQQQVHCPERGLTFNVYVAGDAGPVMLCLHGGGYTGLSWALLARRLKGGCRVVAPDLRCHGLTQALDEADWSAATLAGDVVALWLAMFGGGGSSSGSSGSSSGSGNGSGGSSSGSSGLAQGVQQQQQQQQQQRPAAVGGAAAAAGAGAGSPPPTVLVGHSMGGAIAVHAAALGGIPSLAGIVVIDVVEGTAMASLPYMSTVLQKRPKQFASLRHAVDWALDSGVCKRQEAAHVSLPSMLRQQPPGAAAGGRGGGGGSCGTLPAPPLTASGLEPLAKEGEEEGEEEEGEAEVCAPPQQQPPRAQRPAGTEGTNQQSLAGQQQRQEGQGQEAAGGGWVWRTQLERSAPFWEGWYAGLSDMFLKLPVPKVLVLVGTDRLDRPLTIGQMQGKFQPVLLPQAGHAVHEDEPERTADAIATFIKRFRIGEPPLQIPRPAPGIRPALPVAMGPAFGVQPAAQGKPP